MNIDKTQRAMVWSLEDKGKYTEVKFSTGRKASAGSDEWLNSNWSWVRFVSKAHSKASMLGERVQIVLTNAMITQEPYKVDGVTKYPKNPQLTVFDFEVFEGATGGATQSASAPKAPTKPLNDADDDIPF